MAAKLLVLSTLSLSCLVQAEAEADSQVYGYTPAPASPYAPVDHHPVAAFVHHASPVQHQTVVHPAAHAVAHPPVAHAVAHAQVAHAVVHPAPAYTPAPAYGHAPAYAPAPAYVPAPAYAPAPAYHQPAPYHKPEAHYEPPACSVDNPKTWCLEDAEYPTYEIEHALQYHYEGVQAMYKDVLANTENSVDRLKEIVEETYLCPSVTAYIMPLRAVNTDGKWRVVVNGVKAHYETLTQTARIEECTTAGEACPLVPACYETKCLQKSIYHRFLVYDAYDKYFPFVIETFQLPSACACYNGPYVEPPHKK